MCLGSPECYTRVIHMAPPMSHPFRHPKTGIFWLRKRVPKDLVAVLGRAEVTRSLETRDPGKAKRRLVRALSDLEAQWANLRAGPRTLTEEEAHEMAAPVYDQWLDMHRKEPSQQTFWPVHVGSKVFAPSPPLDLAKVGTSHSWDMDPDFIHVVQLETGACSGRTRDLRLMASLLTKTAGESSPKPLLRQFSAQA